jgi:hypothetical protein
MKKKSVKHSNIIGDAPCAITNGAPNINLYNKKNYNVWCASPNFKPIAYKLSCTNRKWKYFEEKTTATLKIKQTSIATVQNHILIVACFPNPLPFHYPLPLKPVYRSLSSDKSLTVGSHISFDKNRFSCVKSEILSF